MFIVYHCIWSHNESIRQWWAKILFYQAGRRGMIKMGTRNALFSWVFRTLGPHPPRKKNTKPVAIILQDKVVEDDVKLKRKEKPADKIIAWTKNNVKCKGYIGCICLDHIQQEFQAVTTDWLTLHKYEWLKKRYTLQNITSILATITNAMFSRLV